VRLHILNICIRSDLRSRGAGRKLMDRLIERARQAAMQEVLLEVRPRIPSRAFVEAMGFERIGVRKRLLSSTRRA